jgi:hypothetical protein
VRPRLLVARYNVPLHSTGLLSNPACEVGAQEFVESGISQNEVNSFRRLNEKVGMAVRSTRTLLGGGSANRLIPGFKKK